MQSEFNAYLYLAQCSVHLHGFIKHSISLHCGTCFWSHFLLVLWPDGCCTGRFWACKYRAGSPLKKKTHYFVRRGKKCFLVIFFTLNQIWLLQRQNKHLLRSLHVRMLAWWLAFPKIICCDSLVWLLVSLIAIRSRNRLWSVCCSRFHQLEILAPLNSIAKCNLRRWGVNPVLAVCCEVCWINVIYSIGGV